MVQNNPFFIGQPVGPDHFVGRKAEILTAFDQIANRSHLAIWGGTGMGKSSFLKQLASPQVWQEQGQDPSNTLIILLSCQDISPFTPSGFWQEVHSLLREELDNDPQLQTQIENLLQQQEATKDSLRRLLKKLNKQNKFLLLLIDDYHEALVTNKQYSKNDVKNFLSECRSIVSQITNISIIVTSYRSLGELGPKLQPNESPWYNHYLFQPLKPFTDSEVNELLSKSNTMTPALQNGIREIADSNPALLQIAAYLIYRERQQPTGRMANREAFIKEFEAATRNILDAIWDRSTESEQTLLTLIALLNFKGRLHGKSYEISDIDIFFSQKEKELDRLEERGLIVGSSQERKKLYSFTSSLMERKIIQELGEKGSDEICLEQRKKVFLGLMSSKQAEEYIEAIRWLWQHKDKISSIGEIIRKLGDFIQNN